MATLEPPYPTIWRQMKAGMVIPLLGAGASIIGRPSDATWSADGSNFPPTGSELSRFLADEGVFPSLETYDRDDLGKVASYYTEINGRRLLKGLLHEKLSRQYPIGELHRLLANVPVPQLIVVTNYDTLLERAFDEAGKPYDLVVHPEVSPEYANVVLWRGHGADMAVAVKPIDLDRHVDLATTTVVYKIHGTLDVQDAARDSFVITEDDYVEFLARMTQRTAIPNMFIEHFSQRSFLFLGYSLKDWNLRVVFRNLRRRDKERGRDDDPPAWAIQRNPSDLEKMLWDKRDVTIFDQTLDEFASKMRLLQAA